uniref:Uncharacterized protein n=1 Tax=Arundo donax TaxID=35708 RepID=A0A0A8YD07_ARUDO
MASSSPLPIGASLRPLCLLSGTAPALCLSSSASSPRLAASREPRPLFAPSQRSHGWVRRRLGFVLGHAARSGPGRRSAGKRGEESGSGAAAVALRKEAAAAARGRSLCIIDGGGGRVGAHQWCFSSG